MVLMGADPASPGSLEELPHQPGSSELLTPTHTHAVQQVKGQSRLYKRSWELI